MEAKPRSKASRVPLKRQCGSVSTSSCRSAAKEDPFIYPGCYYSYARLFL